MGYLDIILTALALAMDAFAVSVCKGIKMPRLKLSHVGIIALFFGSAQMIMPLIGWLLGCQIVQFIESLDHWIAFSILAFIGLKMIFGALKSARSDNSNSSKLNLKELFVLAIATSIDALAVGITFSFYSDVNIVSSIGIIGAVTFVVCAIGVLLGHLFASLGGKIGAKFQFISELTGGAILVIIGIKLLIEGLTK